MMEDTKKYVYQENSQQIAHELHGLAYKTSLKEKIVNQ